MTEVLQNNVELMTRLVCTGSSNGCYNALEATNYQGQSVSFGSFHSRESGLVAVRRLRRIFDRRSFISKEPLLYCLAKIIRGTPTTATHREDKVRQDAYLLAKEVCETADDLFTFVDFDKQVSDPQKAGWGRGMRHLVQHWYESKTPQALARQVTRCKSTHGWSHRDLIRQCHILPGRKSRATSLVVNYLLNGKKELENQEEVNDDGEVQEVLSLLKAIEALNGSSPEEAELVRTLIERHKLLDRQIPSKLYKLYETYEGLLDHMPMEDLFKSIPKMALMGMLENTTKQSTKVIELISNIVALKEQNVNPVLILCALRKYAANRMKRWVRNGKLIKALQAAFDASLELLPNLCGKSLLVAVHLEGEGRKKFHVKGATYLTPAIATAHLIKFIHKTKVTTTHVFFNERVQDLPINSQTPLVEVLEKLENCKMEEPSFDLAEPIKWAKQRDAKFDNILIISDMKKVTSAQGFQDNVKQYRSHVDLPNCKVAVMGLSDTATAVANIEDLHLLEVSGLNDCALQLLLRFFKGDLDFDPLEGARP